MAYKIPLDFDASWFKNSYAPIEKEVRKNIGDRLEIADDWYQRDYNVKFRTAKGVNYGPWEYVEFKSKQDAVMFMLKWS